MNAMTVEEAVAQLETEGVPTDSVIRAAQYINDLMLNTPQAADKVKALTGETVDGEHIMRVPLVYGYLVQGLVKAHVAKQSAQILDLLVKAKSQADSLIEEQTWMFIADEDTRAEIENADPEVVKAGKAKKGARKVLGLKIYNDRIKGNVVKVKKGAEVPAGKMVRKEAIAILMEEVGLTSAGASTYFANFESGKWA